MKTPPTPLVTSELTGEHLTHGNTSKLLNDHCHCPNDFLHLGVATRVTAITFQCKQEDVIAALPSRPVACVCVCVNNWAKHRGRKPLRNHCPFARMFCYSCAALAEAGLHVQHRPARLQGQKHVTQTLSNVLLRAHWLTNSPVDVSQLPPPPTQ